ncbi:MAG: AAA family ATPase [Desulfobacteraceae bacterium]|nr:AAA family ATPase [Desulfobacteraceae bacterium]MBC2754071.1 AAA family ATPase [Desulfobacteraceae bacterium]
MKCPQCQFENREESKFCNNCGLKLELSCPECNKLNSPGSKFCAECGHKLTIPAEPPTQELSFDEKLEKIQRYLPNGLTDKILSQRDKIEGERKQVTVMFCDLKGFTSISEKLGPEKMYSIMDQVYEILIHKVQDYEGTVNEMTGDGIMALFGAPIALEDAPQRAIRAGIAIHLAMTRYNDKHKDENIPPLKMRIGIHTGPVVVGTLGNDLRVEFKAVGDTVNLASRMEGLAEPGTTYVTEDTFKLTEGFFRFEALGEKQVKGKKDPVKVYRVIATSSRRTRFDVGAERGLTPFIGKERELEILLDGFEMSKSGRGRAFSIVAEAGVGKSRLLYEFRKAVANEDVTFLEGKCLSYGRNMAYHPVIDILKSTFNIEDDDNDDDIRQKVTNNLNTFGVDEASTLPYFLELLSVRDSGIEQIAMSPEGKKAQIIESLNRIAILGSELRPLIMVVEDLHWIDTSSEDVLKDLLSSIPTARILLIFTYRTEYSPPWSGKSYHSQINLNRFSNRESLSMLNHLLDMDDLPLDFEELVFDKTEGVAYYIEEFIKSLQINITDKNDLSSMARGDHIVKIPTTIQDVIMSRVDRLPERSKEILQYGSVIEREFSYELLKHVMALSEQELLANIDILKESELLYERGIFPESTYIFKHALTREVIYDSILTKRKKELHEKIGNAIESLYKGSIAEYYGVLVEHFVQSENYEKSIEYSKMAGRSAQKRSAFKDAISYAKKSVYSLERLPQTDAIQRKLIDTRATLSIYYTSLNSHVEAMEAVAPILDLAVKMDYQKRLPRIFAATGAYNFYVEENLPKAIKELKKTIEVSEKIGDFLSLWFGCYNLGAALSVECEFENSLAYFTKALDLSIAGNNVVGISTAKNTLTWWNYNSQGKIDLAFETTKETLHLAEKSNDIFIKGVTQACYGSALYFKGFFDEAVSHLLEAVDLCEKNLFFVWGANAATSLGYIYFEKGDFEKARSYFDKAVLVAKKEKIMPSLIGFGEIFIAKTKTIQNDVDIDLNTLYSYVYKNKYKSYDGWFSRLIAEILMDIDYQPQSKAEDWIKRAIEFDGKRGLKWQLAMDHAVYSDLFKKNGDTAKAKENLTKAIDIFKECGADGWVEKYEKEMAVM